MKTLMQAIATMEGYYTTSTRPNRNNNPGDVEWGKFAQAHGATRVEVGAFARFAYFPTDAAGFACMRSLLQVPAVFRKNPDGTVWHWPNTTQRFIESGYAGSTIAEALYHWAPPQENNVSAYLKGVCELTGLSPDTIIDGHLQ